MRAKAIIYDLSKFKGRDKTYLIREVFGYMDVSNNGRYRYQRGGALSVYVVEKWGKNVIIIKDIDFDSVKRILDERAIPFEVKNIEIN